MLYDTIIKDRGFPQVWRADLQHMSNASRVSFARNSNHRATNTGKIFPRHRPEEERERVQNKSDSYLFVSNRLVHASGSYLCLVAINSALTQPLIRSVVSTLSETWNCGDNLRRVSLSRNQPRFCSQIVGERNQDITSAINEGSQNQDFSHANGKGAESADWRISFIPVYPKRMSCSLRSQFLHQHLRNSLWFLWT